MVSRVKRSDTVGPVGRANSYTMFKQLPTGVSAHRSTLSFSPFLLSVTVLTLGAQWPRTAHETHRRSTAGVVHAGVGSWNDYGEIPCRVTAPLRPGSRRATLSTQRFASGTRAGYSV